MKLWIISRTGHITYDTYDSAVVAAETAHEARTIHPSEMGYIISGGIWCWADNQGFCHTLTNTGGWCDPDDVQVEYLGETDREISGVILASYNAG